MGIQPLFLYHLNPNMPAASSDGLTNGLKSKIVADEKIAS